MEVFSSAQMTNSFLPSGRPSYTPGDIQVQGNRRLGRELRVPMSDPGTGEPRADGVADEERHT
jgi:hypothetical protein